MIQETPAYLGLLISSFLAATLLPFSSEALLGVMIGTDYNPALCVALATVGNTLGGMTNYFLGYLGKLSWLRKYCKFEMHDIEKFQSRIQKYGAIIAFFCWVPVIGDPLGVALGYFKCEKFKVLTFMFLGKLLRYILVAYSVKSLVLDK